MLHSAALFFCTSGAAERRPDVAQDVWRWGKPPDHDLRSRVLRIERPLDQFPLNLAIVLVDQLLHRIQDEALIQIGAPTGVVDAHDDLEIAGHQRRLARTLQLKRFNVVQRLLTLDAAGSVFPGRLVFEGDKSAGVRLGGGFAEDGKPDFVQVGVRVKLTNKHNLPAPVVRALSFDNYSKGHADFSITELIDSPRVRQLQWLHDEDIEQDVVDNFFSLLGRAVHQLLEWGAEPGKERAEERLFLTVDVDGSPITVSGGMDLQEDEAENVGITDYKVTSVLSATSDKSAWEEQLNLYRELVEKTKNKKVVSLQIIAFLRDWRKANAKREPDYPQSPIIVVPIPLWPEGYAAPFLQQRIRLHLQAGDAALSGEPLAPCTQEERWEDAPTFAVLKPGGKRATKIYDNEDDAKAHVKKSMGALTYERRGGEARRCKGNWCRVARFCDHGRKLLEAEEEDFI